MRLTFEATHDFVKHVSSLEGRIGALVEQLLPCARVEALARIRPYLAQKVLNAQSWLPLLDVKTAQGNRGSRHASPLGIQPSLVPGRMF